jgi:hypothetical protein
MTDNRTTPEAAAGTGRRKRAAPTIDLTATEVQQAAAAGEPPSADAVLPHSDQPPPAQEQPQASLDAAAMAGKEGPGENSWNWMSANINWPALAAGAAGAVMVTLVLFGLWLTGLVPIRYAGSTAMRARVTGLDMQVHDLQNRPAGAVDTKSIDALNGRLNKIEEMIAKLPAGDPGLADRVAVADNAMKSLGVALAALNRRSDDIVANAAQARDRAEAAEKAVTDLRATVQEAAKNASAGISPAELDALQQRVAALEQSAKAIRDDIAKSASATDMPARLVLGAAMLRNAAVSGAPFATELAQAKLLGAEDKALAPLAPFAATGVPAPAALAPELRALIPAMLKISGAQAPAGGFLERLQANAGKLVRIRPMDAPPGDDASAVLARIEIDAAHADIAAALADLDKLPIATRAPALDWIAKAQARQAALAAARQIAADAARALGPKVGTQ